MARTAGKKAAPAKVEQEDDAEGWEDAVVDTDEGSAANLRLRDWRDVERFREMKELRRMVDDDYGLEEIFHIQIKPRTDLGIPPAVRTVVKGANGKAVPAKGAAVPAKGAVVPAKGAALPAKGSAITAKGAPVPVKGAKAVAKAAPAPAHKPAPKAHAKPAHKPAAKKAAPKAKAKKR